MTFLVPRKVSLPFRSCGPGSGDPVCTEQSGWRKGLGQPLRAGRTVSALCSPSGAPGSRTEASLLRYSQDSKTGPNLHLVPNASTRGREHTGFLPGLTACRWEPCLPLWMRLLHSQVPPPTSQSPHTSTRAMSRHSQALPRTGVALGQGGGH